MLKKQTSAMKGKRSPTRKRDGDSNFRGCKQFNPNPFLLPLSPVQLVCMYKNIISIFVQGMAFKLHC